MGTSISQSCCSDRDAKEIDAYLLPQRRILDQYVEETKQAVENLVDPSLEYVTPYWLVLKQITESDNEYFNKCVDLCHQFAEKGLNHASPILHDAKDHQNEWESIQSNAKLCQEPLYEFLQNLIDSLSSFPTADDNEEDGKQQEEKQEGAELIKASLKKIERATEKVETNYDGNWLRLIDVCRSSIVHDNFQQLYFMLSVICKHYRNCFGFEIIKIKNRYQKTTDQGWADITLLIKPCTDSESENEAQKKQEMMIGDDEKVEKVVQAMDMSEYPAEKKVQGLPGHVCEVQLIHRLMWNKRKEGLFGHKAYDITRKIDANAIKIGEKLGGQKATDTVQDAIEFRGDIMGKIGATMFVRKDQDESTLEIAGKVGQHLKDEGTSLIKAAASSIEDGDGNRTTNDTNEEVVNQAT